MKKKKEEKSLSDKVFNVVLVIVLIGFLIVVATSPMANFSFSQNKPDYEQKKKKPEEPMPSELKWFDSFKGIANEKPKEEKGNMNFMK